jgi:hypothetical protein
MAHFNFPSLWKSSDEPATPRGSYSPATKFGLRAPCDFMPQSPAPMMIMSSATPRTQKGADKRALRLLEPHLGCKKKQKSTLADILTDIVDTGEYENDSDRENADVRDDFDINTTPKTPPRTPVTPTTDTSMSSTRSKISITVFTNMFVHVRMTERTLFTNFAILLVLLMVVCLAFEETRDRVTKLLLALLQSLQFASNAAEMGIEGAGWILGKAVGRFAKGFVRGYMMWMSL